MIAATVNKNGSFKFRATRVGDDTTLAQIIRLVEEATSSKAPIAKLADQVAAVFVPTVIAIALIAAAVWLLLGQSFDFALSIGIVGAGDLLPLRSGPGHPGGHHGGHRQGRGKRHSHQVRREPGDRPSA